MKELLTGQELVEHMKSKGITFKKGDSPEDAKNFLEEKNYYLKLASYRSNYMKYQSGPNEGKYINLDYAYLKELATIDRHIRNLVLQMTLDVEHFLKVDLLNSIESNPEEDGYRIIMEFVSGDVKDNNLKPLKKIHAHKSSDYCKKLIEKYYPFFPVWVFVELISFGELSFLCDFYNKKYNKKIGDRILLNSVRDLRNAAAHNNCLIHTLSPGDNRPHHTVVNRVKNIPNISENSRDKKLKNKFVYDFVCLLFAYDDIVKSKETKKKTKKEILDLFDVRMKKNKDFFLKNDVLTSSYIFLKKVIDNVTRTW